MSKNQLEMGGISLYPRFFKPEDKASGAIVNRPYTVYTLPQALREDVRAVS